MDKILSFILIHSKFVLTYGLRIILFCELLVDYGANCDLLNDINENLWDIVATYPDFKEKLQEARRVYERRQQNQKDKLEKLNRSKEMAAAHQSFDFVTINTPITSFS